jgi:hypothetical protein
MLTIEQAKISAEQHMKQRYRAEPDLEQWNDLEKNRYEQFFNGESDKDGNRKIYQVMINVPKRRSSGNNDWRMIVWSREEVLYLR